jgi:peptidoglycan/LPS O-acetylase OafA/YrhL
VLILAGVFTPLCAFAGGLLSAHIAGRARRLAAAILSGLIAVETTYLYTTQRVDGPLWFEAGAAAALILAACAATWLCERMRAGALRHGTRSEPGG